MPIETIINKLRNTTNREISFLSDLVSVAIDEAWILENIPRDIPAGSYHRNLLDLGDDYELVLASWPVGGGTVIHDHGSNDSHGIFRVLKGEISNRVYRLENDDRVIFEKEVVHKLNEKGEVHKGFIHSMGNHSENEVGMTLHLYSPKIVNVKFWDPATLERLQRSA